MYLLSVCDVSLLQRFDQGKINSHLMVHTYIKGVSPYTVGLRPILLAFSLYCWKSLQSKMEHAEYKGMYMYITLCAYVHVLNCACTAYICAYVHWTCTCTCFLYTLFFCLTV